MKILFAIDGSKCSSEAIDSAVKMKCPVGTEFKVVTVVDFYEAFSEDIEARSRQIKAAGKFVEDTVHKLKGAHPNIEVDGAVLDGHVVEQILDCSEKWPADLIMVGSHGRAGLSEFIMGSVSRAVLSNAKCAVRIIRPANENSETKAGMNVIVGLDESEHARNVIDHILRLPWSAGTKFKLINVVPEVNKSVLFDPDLEFAKSAATEYDSLIANHSRWMKEAADQINKTFDQDDIASYEVLLGDPRRTLLEQAKNWPADIIMLGSHGRRGMEKLFLGSVSEAVATHAPCSVEVTRVASFRKEKVSV